MTEKMAASNNLQQVLEPFHQRASQAEERLARLEAAYAGTENSRIEDLLKEVAELQRKLEDAKAEQLSEREKALKEVQQLAAEHSKLQYRITHLVRALKSSDCDLASK